MAAQQTQFVLQASRLLPFVLVAFIFIHSFAHPINKLVVMVVLTAITLFGRKGLHKEDYCFDEQMNVSSSRTEDVLASTPSQYWILGFKDRELEEEYLNDLVNVSKHRIYLGYGMCAFFVFLGQVFGVAPWVIASTEQNWKLHFTRALILYSIVFVAFLVGLVLR